MSQIAIGGLSSCIALSLANRLRFKLNKNYKIIEHPFFDVIGIFIGTIIIILLYKLTIHIISNRIKHKSDEDEARHKQKEGFLI